MNIFKQLWDNFTNLHESKTITSITPTEYVMYNDMYPYTIEKTIKVTHHSKPKRRDPARKWNKKNNYRF